MEQGPIRTGRPDPGRGEPSLGVRGTGPLLAVLIGVDRRQPDATASAADRRAAAAPIARGSKQARRPLRSRDQSGTKRIPDRRTRRPTPCRTSASDRRATPRGVQSWLQRGDAGATITRGPSGVRNNNVERGTAARPEHTPRNISELPPGTRGASNPNACGSARAHRDLQRASRVTNQPALGTDTASDRRLTGLGNASRAPVASASARGNGHGQRPLPPRGRSPTPRSAAATSKPETAPSTASRNPSAHEAERFSCGTVALRTRTSP
jgi:hypothetical protein